MSDNYDSILKEKKVYTEPVYEDKHPLFKKSIKLGIFISIIIIIISYIIYFNSVLAPESIFLNNFTFLYDKYKIVYDNLDFSYNISSNYTLSGSLLIDDKKYDYSFVQDNNGRLMKTLSNNDRFVSYYYDGTSYYVNLSTYKNVYIEKENQFYDIGHYNSELEKISSNFGVYMNDVLLNNTINDYSSLFYNLDNYGDVFENIIDNYTNISSGKYIKKVYLDGKVPVVEVDLVLDRNEVNNILGNKVNNLYVDDDIEISILMKNNAIMNNINSIKVVINNKTQNKRKVITYTNNKLVITDDDGSNKKYVYSIKEGVMTLKYYKDDVLYSVLKGEEDSGRYIYTFQVIDEVYKAELIIDNNGNSYNYYLQIYKDNRVTNVHFIGNYSNAGVVNAVIDKVYEYDELDPFVKQQFNVSIDKFLFG